MTLCCCYHYSAFSPILTAASSYLTSPILETHLWLCGERVMFLQAWMLVVKCCLDMERKRWEFMWHPRGSGAYSAQKTPVCLVKIYFNRTTVKILRLMHNLHVKITFTLETEDFFTHSCQSLKCANFRHILDTWFLYTLYHSVASHPVVCSKALRFYNWDAL